MTQNDAQPDRRAVLELDEAAALARCHPDSLRKLMAEGKAPGTKIGRRWVVSARVFQAWIDERCDANHGRVRTANPYRISGSGRSSDLDGGSALTKRLAANRAARVAARTPAERARIAKRRVARAQRDSESWLSIVRSDPGDKYAVLESEKRARLATELRAALDRPLED